MTGIKKSKKVITVAMLGVLGIYLIYCFTWGTCCWVNYSYMTKGIGTELIHALKSFYNKNKHYPDIAQMQNLLSEIGCQNVVESGRQYTRGPGSVPDVSLNCNFNGTVYKVISNEVSHKFEQHFVSVVYKNTGCTLNMKRGELFRYSCNKRDCFYIRWI